ncbi:hypothetical protein NQ318_010323, partial [Aromia moschata]
FISFLQYGRKDIESAQSYKNQEVNDDDDEGYSEDICSPDKVSESKSITPPNGLKNGMVNGGNNVISRDDKLIFMPEPPTNLNREEEKLSDDELKDGNNKEKFHFDLSTVFDYLKVGVEAIIEDQVTSRFEAEELKNWNLLIRTNRGYEFISWKLTIIWMCGFFIRYFFLFPLRVIICFVGILWLVITTGLVGMMPDNRLKRWLNHKFYVMAFRIMSRSLSGMITIHNKQWRPAKGSVCVANHTSPCDVVILSVDNCYCLIGQRHGGFLGLLQRALAELRLTFGLRGRRLKEHVSNPKNPPILIFPEGTCINNTSVMQFKKGSFEVGSVIYPVAIKYDARFGDAFWNSSRYSMLQYLYMMMTSWAIVCDEEGETAIDFANRVKSVIAKQGGLVDLMWDGQLKRVKPKKEWRERQQEEFCKRLKVE